MTTRDQVRFGTIDTWLVYQLTGLPSPSSSTSFSNIGGTFVTDVTNASRWLFMNISTLQWEKDLIDIVLYSGNNTNNNNNSNSSNEGCSNDNQQLLSFPLSALPTINPSSTLNYGKCRPGFLGDSNNNNDTSNKLDNVFIGGILGDQQAALFGHGAFHQGQTKNTYGTGMFLMMNTGLNKVVSSSGLITTVAYQIGDDVAGGSGSNSSNGDNNKPVYALEGSVSHAGSTLQWLRDQMGIIKDASESEQMAMKVRNDDGNGAGNDGLYLVPAFSGLFAPQWRPVSFVVCYFFRIMSLLCFYINLFILEFILVGKKFMISHRTYPYNFFSFFPIYISKQ